MEKIEALARGWIDCDPNRSILGNGHEADAIEEDRGASTDGCPRWHWFIPRAEAMEDHLRKHGWKIVPLAMKEGPLPTPQAAS